MTSMCLVLVLGRGRQVKAVTTMIQSQLSMAGRDRCSLDARAHHLSCAIRGGGHYMPTAICTMLTRYTVGGLLCYMMQREVGLALVSSKPFSFSAPRMDTVSMYIGLSLLVSIASNIQQGAERECT